MKLRNIFVALAAAVAVFASCEKEKKNYLDEVQLSSSYVCLDMDNAENTTSIVVTATDAWSIDEIPNWLSITPDSGSAGETKVTFSAPKALDGRNCEIKLSCAGKTQIIKVQQGLSVVSEVSCAEVLAGVDGKTYRVSGVCTKIVSTIYGNWYLADDTGEVYIYGTLNKGEEKKFASLDPSIEVGDEVTVEGPKTTYNGTVELVNVTVVNVNKSLVKVDSILRVIPKDGGEFKAFLTCKGDGLSIDIPELDKTWLSVTGINISGQSAEVTFRATANEGGIRNTTLVFNTTKSGKTYSSETIISQEGSIQVCNIATFLAAPDGPALFRITGIVTKIAGESDKYGTNLYIKDASGEAYIYGTADADGKAEKLQEKYGLKVGDVASFVGAKSSYKGSPQMVSGVYQNHLAVETVTVEQALTKPDDKTVFYRVTGKVEKYTDEEIAALKVKNDIETYGNFKLTDPTGSIYVYGVSTGWNGEDKKFGTLGVKYGDSITLLVYKSSYKGLNQLVGKYISHEAAAPAGQMIITDKNFPTAYSAEETTISEGGHDYLVLNVANYGNGIQFKKGGSCVANKLATVKKIKTIQVIGAASKTYYPGNLKVYAGTGVKPEGVEIPGTSVEVGETFDFSGGDYNFFKVVNPSNYAVYLEKIIVTLAD